MGGVEVGGLGRVDHRTAADRDHPIEAPVAHEGGGRGKGFVGGLDRHAIVDRDPDSGVADRLNGSLRELEGDHLAGR